MQTTVAEAIRCVRIGNNTINLHNFLFARTFKTKASKSDGEFGEVFILKFYFQDKISLELQFDTPEACENAREFAETATGGTIVMPEALLQGKVETPTRQETDVSQQ